MQEPESADNSLSGDALALHVIECSNEVGSIKKHKGN